MWTQLFLNDVEKLEHNLLFSLTLSSRRLKSLCKFEKCKNFTQGEKNIYTIFTHFAHFFANIFAKIFAQIFTHYCSLRVV